METIQRFDLINNGFSFAVEGKTYKFVCDDPRRIIEALQFYSMNALLELRFREERAKEYSD